MAYTSLVSNWQTVDPIKDYLPYDEIERRAQKEDEEKLAQYLEWYYSAPEILQRDPEYSELSKSIEDRLTNLSSMIGTPQYTHGNFNRQANFQLLKDQAKYNTGIQKAKILSALIQDRASKGDDMIYRGKVYDENTPLKDVNEMSVNDGIKASTFKELGAILGKELNNSIPLEDVGRLFQGATAILQSGVSHSDVLKQITSLDSDLGKRVAEIKNQSGVTNREQLQKLDEALLQGILSSTGVSYSTMHNPTWQSPNQRRLEEKQLLSIEKQEALEAAMRGDWTSAQKFGAYPIQENGQTVWIYNGYKYKVNENGVPIEAPVSVNYHPSQSNPSQRKTIQRFMGTKVLEKEYTDASRPISANEVPESIKSIYSPEEYIYIPIFRSKQEADTYYSGGVDREGQKIKPYDYKCIPINISEEQVSDFPSTKIVNGIKYTRIDDVVNGGYYYEDEYGNRLIE